MTQFSVLRFPVIGCGAAALWLATLVSAQSATLYRSNGLGRVSVVGSSHGWQKTWHQVVAGRFESSGLSGLLLYDRIRGAGKFLRSDGKGGFSLLKSHGSWRKDWDLVVAGDFGGSSRFTDLLFYNASSGLARFYTCDGQGNISLLKQHTGWQHWDQIVVGQFGGSGRSDLFLYSRQRGQGKFYSCDGLGNIRLMRSYSALNKSWDVVVPGEFGGGATTDLFFYKRVRGEGKFYTTDGRGGITLIRSYSGLRPTWDRIVAGAFGGSAFDDLFFYELGSGRGRFATTDGKGVMTVQPAQTLSPRWRHLVSGRFDTSPRSTVLGYDDTLRIRLHAVQCADDDGSRRTPITPGEVTAWVTRANRAFARAGIQIEFHPATDFELLENTMINTLDNCSTWLKTPSQQAICDAHKAAADLWAARYPCKLVTYFRTGHNRKAGGGFSNESARYLAMPAFSRTSTNLYFQDPRHPDHGKAVKNLKLLAHETGHYLGLDHTFTKVLYGGFSTPHAAVAFHLKKLNSTSLDSLDGDRHKVRDTPPDVGIDYYLRNNWNPADLNQEIRILDASRNVDLRFSPDRHNLMSYFRICDDYLRISPEQARRMRQILHTHPRKARLLDPCAHRVQGSALRYGRGCAGGTSTAPSLSAGTVFETGRSFQLSMSYVAASAPAAVMLGVLRRDVDLGFMGLPGCRLLLDPLVDVPLRTDRSGGFRLPVSIPKQGSLIGRSFLLQCWVADAATRTATKVVTSNALRILVGGAL